MAIVAFDGLGVWVPAPAGSGNVSPAHQSLLLNAAGHKAAMILRIPRTGTIDRIAWRSGALTTSTSTDVRLETVDAATGDPTGTLWAANTNATRATVTADTWFEETLTASASVSLGDMVAVVIAPSGTPNYNVAAGAHVRQMLPGFPYIDHFTTVWARSAFPPCVALRYTDAAYATMPGVFPVQTFQAVTFNSGSTPDERALRCQFPFDVQVAGAWVHLTIGASVNPTFDLVLYDAASTAQRTVTVDPQIVADTNQRVVFVPFANYTMAANTVHRLAVKPTSADDLGPLHEWDVNTAALFDTVEGGSDVHLSTRTDVGAWTDTTTRRPWMGLLVNGIDSGGGTAITAFTGLAGQW